MIEPIKLNEFGEMMEMIKKHLSGSPTEDEDGKSFFFGKEPAKKPIGVHSLCWGFMHMHQVSKTHNALHCKKCGLRIVISNKLKTYGDLRHISI